MIASLGHLVPMGWSGGGPDKHMGRLVAPYTMTLLVPPATLFPLPGFLSFNVMKPVGERWQVRAAQVQQQALKLGRAATNQAARMGGQEGWGPLMWLLVNKPTCAGVSMTAA